MVSQIKEEIQVSFANLEDYVSAIENYIEQGDLICGEGILLSCSFPWTKS